MRQTLIVLTAALALALPATALAGNTSTSDPNASQTCKTLRDKMGTSAFEAAYGTNTNKSNAFGKCVSKMSSAQKADRTSANSKCKTEQSDANFAATHGGKTFAQFYGTDAALANAFGQCVSAKAKAAGQTQLQATVSAAKTCRGEMNANRAAFKTKYRTFGRCVSQHVTQ